MAGARIGYAIGPAALINQFEKLRNHFGLNITAYAGAIAALEDQAYLKEAVGRIARARDRITQIALGCGLKPITSATNFVAVDMGGDGARAREVLNRLLENDIFVRIPGVAPLNRCVRISCGTDADIDLLAEVLPKVV
jgi:histidinol-phosphate aminotransferase